MKNDPRDSAATPSNVLDHGGEDQLRIAILGSCVSRDTCEYLPGAEVVAYVARQSMITVLHPVGADRFPADALESDFQARMFAGDQVADGVDRVLQSSADLLLVDLVDERRGVWKFPDGSFLTNSLEATRTGVEEWAPSEGARLIPFGTDEHFELWTQGLVSVIRQLRAHSRIPMMFVDLDWAERIADERSPRGTITAVGRMSRRVRRGIRSANRAAERGEDLRTQLRDLVSPPPTPSAKLIDEAREANGKAVRYRNFAEQRLAGTHIRRTKSELRMSSKNQWGIAPYHYRDTDYESVALEIKTKFMHKKGGHK